MFCKVVSADVFGVDAHAVSVEADISGGLPFFGMVGLPSSEVKEAKERVERAIINSGFDFPVKRITINLAPANIKKQGSGLDLPIALAILAAAGTVDAALLSGKLFVGELSLDGSLNRVRGVLPIAIKAKEMGFGHIIVPEGNAFEGASLSGIKVHGAKSLKELVKDLAEGGLKDIEHMDLKRMLKSAYEKTDLDFSEVQGQEKAKRATAIAVGGFHNLMYVGPPGAGKSMMAERIPSIMSPLTVRECLEVSKIYSVMGLLGDSLVLKRPFRAPHQSITEPALIGGGNYPRPGEVTLAHCGVLFLDEMLEFRRSVIQSLRIPLETKKVVISRAALKVCFPASFLFLAAANPCKCGYYPTKRCKCTQKEIESYFSKARGPILDRIDICVGVGKVKAEELTDSGRGLSSDEMRKSVITARNIQDERFKDSQISFNSQMRLADIKKYCALSAEAQKLLKRAYDKFDMSARGYYKILRVARTIADMQREENIRSEHILEAIGYRNTFTEGREA